MKARFSEKQPSVLTKTIDGYLFVYICLNETKVEEEFENVKQTYYEYDYHEFKEDDGVLDVDAIIQNPSLFMDYPSNCLGGIDADTKMYIDKKLSEISSQLTELKADTLLLGGM